MVLVAAALLVALLGGEGLARLWLGNMAQVYLYQKNPPDGRCFGLLPGAKVDYTGWWSRIDPVLLEVNDQGYRGPSLPQQPAGVPRVAMLGDSFVYGQVVGEGETIPASLEKELGIPVMNFGIPGLALADLEEQYRLFVRQWHPRWVIVLLTGNDLEPSLCESGKSWPPGWVLAEFRLFRVGYMLSRSVSPPAMPSDPAGALRGSLKALQAQVQADGAQLLGVVMQLPEARNRPVERDRAQRGHPSPPPPPTPGGPPRPPPPPEPVPGLSDAGDNSVYQALEADGVPWMDARIWTEGTMKDRLEIVEGEGHFTASANQRAAREIAVWLADNGVRP